MNVAARAATPEDLPALDALLTTCAASLESARGGNQYLSREFSRPPYAGALASLLGSADGLVLCGTLDEQVLGAAIGRIETLPEGGRLGRLELIFVDPGAREVGLGEELLRATVAWATENGAKALDAYALPGDRELKNFLESSGLVARLIVMHFDLNSPPPA